MIPPQWKFPYVRLVYPNVLFIAICAISTPKNVAALAGTALAKAGPNPGKKAFTPPLPYSCRMVPMMLRFPSAD